MRSRKLNIYRLILQKCPTRFLRQNSGHFFQRRLPSMRALSPQQQRLSNLIITQVHLTRDIQWETEYRTFKYWAFWLSSIQMVKNMMSHFRMILDNNAWFLNGVRKLNHTKNKYACPTSLDRLHQARKSRCLLVFH